MLSTRAQLESAIAWAKALGFYKASATSEGAGTWASLWKRTGFPGAGNDPPAYSASGTDFRPTRASVGALPEMRNPGGSNKLYLAEARVHKSTVGKLILYDRLWHCGGFSTNTTSTQTITNGSSYPVNRGAANGAGVEPWLEVYSVPGATGATWTVNFQDQELSGVGSSTYEHPANAETAGQMMPLIMADGSRSVYYPIDFTCSAASGTAGDIGITLLRRICEIDIRETREERVLGYLETGLAEVPTDACLALMVLCSSTVTGIAMGSFKIAEG